MRAVRTPETNVTLTLPGGTEKNDLPAQRINAYNPDLGQTEKDARPAFESHWEPSPDERRALAAGAQIALIVHGDGHPPVSVGVTDPGDDRVELVDRSLVNGALGALYAALETKARHALAEIADQGGAGLGVDDLIPDASRFIEVFDAALNELIAPTAEPTEQIPGVEGPTDEQIAELERKIESGDGTRPCDLCGAARSPDDRIPCSACGKLDRDPEDGPVDA
jgi:hypothetical protein